MRVRGKIDVSGEDKAKPLQPRPPGGEEYICIELQLCQPRQKSISEEIWCLAELIVGTPQNCSVLFCSVLLCSVLHYTVL